MSITELWNDERKIERTTQKKITEAESRYQLKEFNGEIWLTYDGWLICPSSMLKDDAVTALKEMRRLFVERNTK